MNFAFFSIVFHTIFLLVRASNSIGESPYGKSIGLKEKIRSQDKPKSGDGGPKTRITESGEITDLFHTPNYIYLIASTTAAHIKIKSTGQANIALTGDPFISPPIFQFHLNFDNKKRSSFLMGGLNEAEVNIREIPSADEYIEILLFWDSKSAYLIMARIGDPIPIFHWKDKADTLQQIRYFGISTGPLRSQSNCECQENLYSNNWQINLSPDEKLVRLFSWYFNSSNPLFKDDQRHKYDRRDTYIFDALE